MKKILLIFIGIGVVATCTHFSARAIDRIALLKQLKSNSREYERTQVIPEQITITDNTPVDRRLYDIGYATFSSPENIQLKSSKSGNFIYCSCEAFEILISPPVDQKISRKADNKIHNSPLLPEKSLVDRSIEREESKLLSTLEMLIMSEGEFNRRSGKLFGKSKQWAGYSGTYIYSTSWSKGLIMVGRDRTDYSVAQVDIDDLADKLTIRLSVISQKNAALDLEPILSSFRFSVDSVGSAASISNLVSKVGIQQKEDE